MDYRGHRHVAISAGHPSVRGINALQRSLGGKVRRFR
jgi:hypothetical protein